MNKTTAARLILFAFAALFLGLLGNCHKPDERLEPRSLTWAELRAVRNPVLVTPPGESERRPYPHERLADGARIRIDAGGLAWLRRDGGATLLVRGPARLTLRARSISVDEGRVFIDTPPGSTNELVTPSGKLTLAAVRASLSVPAQGAAKAYVLAGEVRAEQGRARAGEELSLEPGGAARVAPVLGWDDWTGGLATTDRAPAPAPYGVGTVGARSAGAQGTPRFPLSIQRMNVRVTIDGDFALTEVDQSFFNPSSETVEGIYGFRAPERAVLQRFGVDRDNVVVWGRVKEKAAAAAQYQANVYQGSTEDPALLEWDAPGVYRARLYPIGPGETRRVVVRYAEWLDRTGASGERRLYVYPMAADGSEDSLPHVEELRVSVDLERAGAREVRVGMAGVRSGNKLVVRAHDFVPRADLAVELLDEGVREQRAYRAPHRVDFEAIPPDERQAAAKKAELEADYLLVPVRANDVKLPGSGLDLAIVIDASAATERATLALARAATSALLSHLGDQDRAVVLAGDDGLRPVVAGWSKLEKVDAAARLKVKDALSRVARGGATDLGAMLAAAAHELEPGRRSALVYIGDAVPTVGELSLTSLRERLSKLPAPVRVFGLGVGDAVKFDILAGLSQGGFAERISDGYSAVQSALHVLEETERPAWLGTKIDLGPGVERLFPSQVSALVSGETLWVIGRMQRGRDVQRLKTSGASGTSELPLKLETIEDRGDLGRRWAAARLSQMLEAGEGRAALVDLGMKNGIITPVTSFYVPTKSEMTPAERAELADNVDNKEGGIGTRAKGEEGSMGSLRAAPTAARAAVAPEEPMVASAVAAAPPVAPPVAPSPVTPSSEAQRLQPMRAMAGAATKAAPAPGSPVRDQRGGDEKSDAVGAGGLGLSGTGAGGGGIGLSSIGTLGGGLGTGQGFGAGHGRLGSSHAASAPKVRPGAIRVSGRLPPEVVERIVRQNVGRFRMCYEQGLARDPRLQGSVSARFVIGGDGTSSNVSDGGSDLADAGVRSCVLATLSGLSFPEPEDGPVVVVYPILFTPGGGDAPATIDARVTVNVLVGELPRQRLGCSAAADAPFEERVGLWRERLSKVLGSAAAITQIYRSALASCEAPSYRERARLLSLMLDAMPAVRGKVALYRSMAHDLGAADVLYRGLLARIHTPEEMRELHEALGLKAVDPAILAKLVDSTPETKLRAAKLRALWAEFPDDLALALELLNAYEDATDDAAARDLARQLRERPDADARVRTAVGELYLRLAEKAATPQDKAALQAEGRRAFGEIVEFAPEDPVARRRLGDLLMAHAFFSDAARQYETLSRLIPDDPTVAILRAGAAEGQGLLEEALKWAEKGGASGAPDGSSGASGTARALAATHLAWARLAAREANRSDELDALLSRAARVLSGASQGPERPSRIRVSLIWSHPELHPSLWSNALGAAMPAPDGDITLGVAEAFVPERGDAFVEVRLEPTDVAHAARLGATAELTVVFDELGKTEKIVRKRVQFARGGPPVQRFALGSREVQGG
jgi:Ca-activated chloride channel family protein